MYIWWAQDTKDYGSLGLGKKVLGFELLGISFSQEGGDR